MDETGEKNWGLIALMVILIIGVLTMAVYTFMWGGVPPSLQDEANAPAAAVSSTPNAAPGFSIVPPPIEPPPIDAPASSVPLVR